jgi:hypothetical protein
MGRAQDLALGQIPAAQRAYSGDRSRVLGWYVARHDEDRWDEVTEYRVALFDARTEERLTFLVTSVHERTDTGTKDGEHLASAAFDPADDNTIILRYADGSEQRRQADEAFKKVLEQNPEDRGVVMSEGERSMRERMRQMAEKLKKKP